MSKALKIYIFSFVVLIVLMIAVDQSRTKPLDWTPSYQLPDKIPMGLYVLDREIDHLLGDSATRYENTFYEYAKETDSTNIAPKTYLFINDYVYFDEESLGKLLDEVQKGCSVFISSDGFPPSLTDTLHAANEYEYIETSFSPEAGDTLILTLANPGWGNLQYALSPIFGQMPFSQADSATTTALGYMIYPGGERFINFIRVKWGKGFVFLHNQPAAFANYSLLSGRTSQEYVEHVLSYLPEKQPTVWFVKNQVRSNAATTPLRVIFSYPALRMVWLVFVYGLLLFIFFTAKRRQHVVPIIKPLRNTTVEFTQTIGNLYYQEGDITNIARKKITYFLDRIRQTYHLDTQLLDESFVQRLHLKSGKELQIIRNAINFIKVINEKERCDKTGLTLLNEYIEIFWDAPQKS